MCSLCSPKWIPAFVFYEQLCAKFEDTFVCSNHEVTSHSVSYMYVCVCVCKYICINICTQHTQRVYLCMLICMSRRQTAKIACYLWLFQKWDVIYFFIKGLFINANKKILNVTIMLLLYINLQMKYFTREAVLQ